MAALLAYGWELKFRLACLDRSGDEYQDLFASIMERRDPGFRRVRPWGNAGDRKNDGWSPARRMLFQCYAPSSLSVSDLTGKMDDDYDGAAAYWQDYFDTWVFVHNDLDGMAPHVALKIVELDGKSEDITCTSWGHPQLRDEFAELTDQDRAAILGPALTHYDFLHVDAEALKPMLEALGRMVIDPATPVAPVPVDKIDANDLVPAQVEFLTFGSVRAPLVEQYLTNAFVLPTHADEIATAVSARYRDLRDAGKSASQVFDELLSWVSGGSGESAVLANALAVLAYFFDRCHIFESPGDPT